jgi:hypothetical protein
VSNARIIPCSNLSQTCNNIIQKGLAFVREQSGSVIVLGARRASGSCPAGCMATAGLWWWGNDAAATQRRIPMSRLTDTQLIILSVASQRDDRGVELPANIRRCGRRRNRAELVVPVGLNCVGRSVSPAASLAAAGNPCPCSKIYPWGDVSPMKHVADDFASVQ